MAACRGTGAGVTAAWRGSGACGWGRARRDVSAAGRGYRYMPTRAGVGAIGRERLEGATPARRGGAARADGGGGITAGLYRVDSGAAPGFCGHGAAREFQIDTRDGDARAGSGRTRARERGGRARRRDAERPGVGKSASLTFAG